MAEDVVLYSKSNGIATITLNRPEKANTLRVEVIDGLDHALADLLIQITGMLDHRKLVDHADPVQVAGVAARDELLRDVPGLLARVKRQALDRATRQ